MTRQDLRSKAGLVIDTNLLLLYLVDQHDPERIETFKRTQVFSADDFNLLVRFINLFGSFSTTPNILTEVSNLIEGVEYDDVPLLTVLRDKVNYREEHYVNSRIILSNEDETFVKFGVSDTVLYQLARANYLILTVDLPLWAFLQNKGLSAVNFNNLRSDSLLR